MPADLKIVIMKLLENPGNIARRWELVESEITRMSRDFERLLKEDTVRICLSRVNYYRLRDSQCIEIESQREHPDNRIGKECTGTFRINLVGSILGMDRISAKIKVVGGIFVGTDENDTAKEVYYRNKDYDVIEWYKN
jgi:hypothetical protein